MNKLCVLSAIVLPGALMTACGVAQMQGGPMPPPGPGITTASPTCPGGAPVGGTTVVTLYNFAIDSGGQRSVTVGAEPAYIPTGCWNVMWIISSGPFTFSNPPIKFTTSFPGGQTPGLQPIYTVFFADPAVAQSWKYSIYVQAPTPGGGTQKWMCDPRVVATGSRPAPVNPTALSAASLPGAPSQVADDMAARAAAATPMKVLCSLV